MSGSRKPRNRPTARQSWLEGYRKRKHGRLWIPAAIIAMGIVTATVIILPGTDPLGRLEWAPPPVPMPDLTGLNRALGEKFTEARKAVIVLPDSASAWGEFGMLCDAHNLLEEAESCYRRSRQLDPSDFRWSYFLAITREKQGAPPEEVVKFYQSAAMLDESYAPVAARLGASHLVHGSLDDAERAYRRAVMIQPNSGVARRGLGQALLAKGEIKEALEHLERALSAGVNDAAMIGSLATAYMRSGDPDRADEMAQRIAQAGDPVEIPDPVRAEVTALGSGPRAIYIRAKRLYDNEECEEAILGFTQVREMLPRDPYAPLFQALCLIRLGRFDEADETFKIALKLGEALDGAAIAAETFKTAGWEFRVSYLGLATKFGTRQQAQEVLDEFITAAKQDPDSVTPRGYLTWGNIYHRAGELEKSLMLYEESLKRDPNYAKAYYNIGVTYEQLGQTENAKANYRKAVELDPLSEAGTLLSHVDGT